MEERNAEFINKYYYYCSRDMKVIHVLILSRLVAQNTDDNNNQNNIGKTIVEAVFF